MCTGAPDPSSEVIREDFLDAKWPSSGDPRPIAKSLSSASTNRRCAASTGPAQQPRTADFCSQNICKICYPFLIRRIGGNLPIKDVFCDGGALTAVDWQATTPGSCARCLLAHESFETMQSTSTSRYTDLDYRRCHRHALWLPETGWKA